MKEPSKERGCHWKTNLGSDIVAACSYADTLKNRFKKEYGVYNCPHCNGHHLTTKLHKKDEYKELLYSTVDK